MEDRNTTPFASRILGAGPVVVTLNRPHVANALNTRMGDLLAFFDAQCRSGLAFRFIVLTGAGERVFCAGGV